MMEYKGIQGTVEYSEDDLVFHGQLLDVDGLITYESDSEHGLEQSFHKAVDDYLEFMNHDSIEFTRKHA